MPRVQEFFDKDTYTLSYIVYDEASRDAIVIDPVFDYESAASLLTQNSLGRLLQFMRERDLKLHMILETHAHADHVSSSQPLQRLFPTAVLGIGSGITEVQRLFKSIYNLGSEFAIDGRQFNRLLTHGERLSAGRLQFEVRTTPGHTPACVSYLFDGLVFVGDALFMPDYGTGRCDFPGGSAAQLYRSIQDQIYSLPEDVLVYTGHDYLPQGRPLRFAATVGEQRQSNIHLQATTQLDDFVSFRQKRDAGLSTPRLLYPSVQINIDGGRLPSSATNGQSYLKIPIHVAET